MTTDLTNGTKKIDLGNMHWYDDITHNWELLDRLIGIVQSLNIDNIPTKTSDLTNDLGFVTEDSLTDVNNGTLNLQRNGATIGTFKANQPTDVTVNFKVPTKTSELTNDKHFVTLEELPNSGAGTGTLTIKKNNAVQGTFTPTQDENVTINLTVPLKVSELINDTGFITNAGIPSKTSQLTNDTGFITNADISIPTKTSQLTNDTGFITNADISIPSKTSQLENDSGFITNAAIPTKTSQLTNDSGFITNADISIPSKTSQLTNDSGFITNAAIPTKTSQLTNDSGFITNAGIPTKTSQLTNDSGFAIDANIVHKNNNETINGDKTFNDKVICKNLYINGYKCTIE